jgi:hypothetical protein
MEGILMMRFRIAQCLCGPARHAILALAVNTPPAEMPDTEALALVKDAVAAALAGRGAEIGLPPRLDPWCGLCGAADRAWTYDVGWSREFLHWDAALCELRACEADQQLAAALFDLLDVSFNARLRADVARQVDER